MYTCIFSKIQGLLKHIFFDAFFHDQQSCVQKIQKQCTRPLKSDQSLDYTAGSDMSSIMRKPVFRVSNTNHAEQPQKMARGLEF